jgi:hypothetical protein
MAGMAGKRSQIVNVGITPANILVRSQRNMATICQQNAKKMQNKQQLCLTVSEVYSISQNGL